MWLLATLMVVFGAHFSALWIMMANSWMQTPPGYVVQETPAPARVVMTISGEVVFTPSFLPRRCTCCRIVDRRRRSCSASAPGTSSRAQRRAGLLDLKLALSFFAILTSSTRRCHRRQHRHRGDRRPAGQAGLDGGGVAGPEHALPCSSSAGSITGRRSTTGVTIPSCELPRLLQGPQALVQGLKRLPPASRRRQSIYSSRSTTYVRSRCRFHSS